jgi:hypothetical protein
MIFKTSLLGKRVIQVATYTKNGRQTIFSHIARSFWVPFRTKGGVAVPTAHKFKQNPHRQTSIVLGKTYVPLPLRSLKKLCGLIGRASDRVYKLRHHDLFSKHFFIHGWTIFGAFGTFLLLRYLNSAEKENLSATSLIKLELVNKVCFRTWFYTSRMLCNVIVIVWMYAHALKLGVYHFSIAIATQIWPNWL